MVGLDLLTPSIFENWALLDYYAASSSLEDVFDKLSRNVGKKLPLLAA
jgi:hypothetical protein